MLEAWKQEHARFEIRARHLRDDLYTLNAQKQLFTRADDINNADRISALIESKELEVTALETLARNAKQKVENIS
ncbi:hypothetical protein [Granulicella arctica]|uniref:hypothetical protein n=1 Tax=Granulicella arctica TaxID=940613 RepID=UPI0021E0860A|nr:hypothetical protein [Granulicella arctica]